MKVYVICSLLTLDWYQYRLVKYIYCIRSETKYEDSSNSGQHVVTFLARAYHVHVHTSRITSDVRQVEVVVGLTSQQNKVGMAAIMTPCKAQ